MKKKVFGRKLSRDNSSRRALFRLLVRALVANGKIVTTKAKAKAVQPDAERLVNLAKTKDVATIRQVYSFLANDRQTTDRLFNHVAKAFSGKTSGFTRIVNLPRRLGDFAEMARIEWTEKIEVSDKKSGLGNKKKKAEKESVKVEAKEAEKSTLKSKLANIVKGNKK